MKNIKDLLLLSLATKNLLVYFLFWLRLLRSTAGWHTLSVECVVYGTVYMSLNMPDAVKVENSPHENLWLKLVHHNYAVIPGRGVYVLSPVDKNFYLLFI